MYCIEICASSSRNVYPYAPIRACTTRPIVAQAQQPKIELSAGNAENVDCRAEEINQPRIEGCRARSSIRRLWLLPQLIK